MTTLAQTHHPEREQQRPSPQLRWLLRPAGRLRASWSRATIRGQLGGRYDDRHRDGYRSAQDRITIPRAF